MQCVPLGAPEPARVRDRRRPALTASTQSPPCRRNTPCGLGTRRPNCCRCCASWASASFPIRRSATASSPARFALPSSSPTTIGARPIRASAARTFNATCASRRGQGRCRRGGCNTGADRSGVAARAGRRRRSDPRHQAGRSRRGEHRGRPHRAERRADRTAEQSHAGRWRAPRRRKYGRDRPLTTPRALLACCSRRNAERALQQPKQGRAGVCWFARHNTFSRAGDLR